MNDEDDNFHEQIGLCRDIETENFDMSAGQTWIYPTNCEDRSYQYNIIQTALFHNTLISLPTGLGKTFIAAVVMYNFYRWYPHGKIIFMAPTRPLVKQQIDACYNIMAIPKEVTVEMTGAMSAPNRANVWANKRVFYVTPQVLQNDLPHLLQFSKTIRCLVFDEAHHAKGRYAYCDVIEKLKDVNPYFRVVALSATPGSKLDDVAAVMRNLLIEKIENRTEDSLDVRPFVFKRKTDVIQVPCDPKIEEVTRTMFEIIEPYVRQLVNNRIISGNYQKFTKHFIIVHMKKYNEKYRDQARTRPEKYQCITRCLSICVTLYHGLDLLRKHGLWNFVNYFQEHGGSNPLIRSISKLVELIASVKSYLGPGLSFGSSDDLNDIDVPANIHFGHVKHYKLQEILVAHFEKNREETTKCIVFCEYRDSVMEVYAALLQKRPLVKPKMFMGQGMMSQKAQFAVIEKFRAGEYNTLVSTSIGEEGLDVGEVDLIVCFDVSTKSPIRLVQRMGRTGRKREGKVIFLVTPGKEYETLLTALKTKSLINDQMIRSSALNDCKYDRNPRMVPAHVHPKCQKLYITVPGKSAKDQFVERKRATRKHSPILSNEPRNVERIDTGYDHIQSNAATETDTFRAFRFEPYLNISYYTEITSNQFVANSKNSQLLKSLLESTDRIRFNLPPSTLELFPERNTLEKKRMIFDGFRTNDSKQTAQNPVCDRFLVGLTDIAKYAKIECKVCESSVLSKLSKPNEQQVISDTELYKLIDSIDLVKCHRIVEEIETCGFPEISNDLSSGIGAANVVIEPETVANMDYDDDTVDFHVDYANNYRNYDQEDFDMESENIDWTDISNIVFEPEQVSESTKRTSFETLNSSTPRAVSQQSKEEILGSDSIDLYLDEIDSMLEQTNANGALTATEIQDIMSQASRSVRRLNTLSDTASAASTVTKRKSRSRSKSFDSNASTPIASDSSESDSCTKVTKKAKSVSFDSKQSTPIASDSSASDIAIDNCPDRIETIVVQRDASANQLPNPFKFLGWPSLDALLKNIVQSDGKHDVRPPALTTSYNGSPAVFSESEDCLFNDVFDRLDSGAMTPPIVLSSAASSKNISEIVRISGPRTTADRNASITACILETQIPAAENPISTNVKRRLKFWDDAIFKNNEPANDRSSKRVCRDETINSPFVTAPKTDPCPKTRHTRRNTSNFIDDEAVDSDDDGASDDRETDTENESDKEFIDDQICVDSPSIQNKYIQTTKSPMVRIGAFKIPDLRNYPTDNVYSQNCADDARNDTYAYDSFVIPNDEIVYKTQLSQIDEIERQLKKKRKSKYKRLRTLSDDDSDSGDSDK